MKSKCVTICDGCDDTLHRTIYIVTIVTTVTEVKKRGVIVVEIRISKSLFNSLYRYHVCGQQEDEQLIKKQLAEKMDRHIKRIVYTQSKREDARQSADRHR